MAVELAPALLAGILAAQVAQLGAEAGMLWRQSSIKTKVDAMWKQRYGHDG